MMWRSVTMLLLTLCAPMACRASGTGATSAPASSQPALTHFESAKGGIAVDYPSDWTATKINGEDVLTLVTKRVASATVEVAVPSLPPHLPGMIPIGAVADGYVKDLKKRHADEHVDERVEFAVPQASARRVVSTMTNDGRPWRDMAVLVSHDNKVFILSADCAADDYATTRSAFDTLVASVKWTK